MPPIELPRALEEYFAFAETDPTRHGRRFSITLPYRNGDRLERLQWWYHVSPAQEQMFDGCGLATFRLRAIQRFLRHIERWLHMTRQRLHGEDAIPLISREAAPVIHCADAPSEASAEATPWPVRQYAS